MNELTGEYKRRARLKNQKWGKRKQWWTSIDWREEGEKVGGIGVSVGEEVPDEHESARKWKRKTGNYDLIRSCWREERE